MPSFDRFASDYREVLAGSVGSATYFADTKAAWVMREVGSHFAGKILDFGCGVGLLAEALANVLPSAELTGFDVSEESLAAIDPALRARAQFTGDASTLGQHYDLAVVSNVLHHVPPPERDGLVAELGKRLRPGGKLLIFEHNPLNPLTRVVVARCAFDDDAILLWPSEAERRMQRAGLRTEVSRYVAFFPKPLANLRKWEGRLGWCPLGAQYVAVGVKP